MPQPSSSARSTYGEACTYSALVGTVAAKPSIQSMPASAGPAPPCRDSSGTSTRSPCPCSSVMRWASPADPPGRCAIPGAADSAMVPSFARPRCRLFDAIRTFTILDKPCGHVKARSRLTLSSAPGPAPGSAPGPAPGSAPGFAQGRGERVRLEKTTDCLADLQTAGDQVDLALVQAVHGAAQGLIRLDRDDQRPTG